MIFYILIFIRFNKIFIRYFVMNILLVMVDNMSVICCILFIYFLVVIYSFIVYYINNISSEGSYFGWGIY